MTWVKTSGAVSLFDRALKLLQDATKFQQYLRILTDCKTLRLCFENPSSSPRQERFQAQRVATFFVILEHAHVTSMIAKQFTGTQRILEATIRLTKWWWHLSSSLCLSWLLFLVLLEHLSQTGAGLFFVFVFAHFFFFCYWLGLT